MKKLEYVTPDLEILDLKLNYNVLQAGSPTEDEEVPGTGDAGEL